LENTIKMIKELNMKIVVEGIETRELADYFANLGCDYIQGYYYARPMAGDEFKKFIKKNSLLNRKRLAIHLEKRT
ncbi:MAG: EAL domain-containing protein, partial [Lachnospiraceae bacterium]|nr:EAL domain-containing protein [Lachnospiraceae bacterium]